MELDGLDLDRVTTDTAAIARAVERAPTAAVACYDGWTLVELGVHVGQVQRWVTGIVTDRAQERPTGPMAPAPDDGLPAWLRAGAAELVAALGAVPPDTTVWTISRHHDDVGFWRRRMVLEAALHRWDADDATGVPPSVDEAVALAGVAEALDVYLGQRLAGQAVGGDGQRVALLPEGGDGWTVTLREDGIDVTGGRVDPDAVVVGPALDLWLLLSCRRDLDGLEVEGDADAAALLAAAAHLVAGPAG